jgi:hypothetical protein
MPTASIDQEDPPAPDAEPDITTIRLIGGGGEIHKSHSPVEVDAEEVREIDSEPSPPAVHHDTNHESESNSSTQATAPSNKKLKNGLVNLKRFSIGAFGRNRDSVSSLKDASSR